MAMRILKPLVRWGGYYPSKKYTPLVYPGGYTTMDAAIGPLDPLNTFSGDIVRFTTKRGLPMQSVKVHMSPVQDLHGYANPWPPGGGANKWNEEWETGWIGWAGQDASSDNQIRSKGFIPVVAGETYRIVSSINIQIFYYDANKDFISYHESSLPSQSTFTIPSGCAYIRFYTYYSSYGGTYKNDIAINYPSSVTTYSPYSNNCPISGWTGCEVNVDGKNLLNMDNPDGLWGGATCTKNEDGSITVVTSSGGGASVQYLLTGKLKPGTYTATNLSVRNLYVQNSPSDYTHVVSNGNSYTFNYDGESYLRLVFTNQTANTTEIYKAQIELDSTASDYEPFRGNSYSVTWPDEVFGGSAEVVDGNLSDNRWSAIYDGSEAWYMTAEPSGGVARYYVANQIPQQNYSAGVAEALSSIATVTSNDSLPIVNTFHVRAFNNRSGWVGFAVDSTLYPTVADFKALLSTLYQNGTPVQVVAVTDHPVETAITPTPITALFGYNNVWSDAGPVEVVAYGTPIEEPDVEPLGALGLLLGGAYRNDHTPDDVSDEEALDILLGGADR